MLIFNANVAQLQGAFEASGKAGHRCLSPPFESIFAQWLGELGGFLSV